MKLEVYVEGTPAPQGSKSIGRNRRTGRPVLIESSKAVKPWRAAVVEAVAEVVETRGWEPVDGPATVTVVFYLARPKSVPKWRTRPWVKPDLDKLTRSTLDALTTARALEDDARVVRLVLDKFYAAGATPPGALITVERTDPDA
jgi:Holliday junction resolvase RusA-like endonuclease